MSKAIVVFNAGSTSLKFGAYAVDETTSLPLLSIGTQKGPPIGIQKGPPSLRLTRAMGVSLFG